MTGLRRANRPPAVSPRPSRANAKIDQVAPWVYCPPFSRMPRRIALDVSRIGAVIVERWRQQQRNAIGGAGRSSITASIARAAARRRRRRRARSRTVRSVDSAFLAAADPSAVPSS